MKTVSLIAAAMAMVTIIAATDYGRHARGDRDKTGTGGGCSPTPSSQVTADGPHTSTGSFAVETVGVEPTQSACGTDSPPRNMRPRFSASRERERPEV